MAKLSANWWILSKKQLEELHRKDAIWRKEEVPIIDRTYANFALGEMYVKYNLLFQQLDACYDHMVQPQKKKTVKKLVDAATLRLLEFNDALIELDLSEFHYIDRTLVELKLMPYEIEILHPALFSHRPVTIEEMWRKIQRGERIYISPEEEEELRRQEEMEGAKKRRPQPKKVDTGLKEQTSEEKRAELARIAKVTSSIKMIQTAERGRQERLYFFIKVTIIKRKQQAKEQAILAMQAAESNNKSQNTAVQTEEEKVMKELAAAIIIQRYWRGYWTREQVKAQEKKRRLLIGMYEPSWRSKDEFITLNEAIDKRREFGDLRLKEYIESIDTERVRVLRVIAPRLMEDISDEIREWFSAWYKTCHMFDNFPPAALGGTCVIVRGDTLTPQEYLKKKAMEKALGPKGVKALQKKEKADAAKKKKLEKAQLKKEKALKKKLEAARKKEIKALAPDQFKYFYDPPIGEDLYIEGIQEHDKFWKFRDELKNPSEKHYLELVTEEHIYETQIECRKIVDEFMRIELELLKDALARDSKKKSKPQKEKKSKAKKEKKSKDPTGDRLIEDLFQELVDNNVIRKYPNVTLEEFIGDFSYKNFEIRAKDLDPPAAVLDVRQAVVMNCIIPMGVDVMKRPRSVLIVGHRQSGKHILANAVFNSTRCVLFDLTPENIEGKYEGSKGTKMLVHLVTKMSKILAPSIIFFDGAEKPFYKKVPKEEKRFNPKKFGKNFKDLIKAIKPEDRVLVLGISGQPSAAKGTMNKMYDKHILIPRPDYNTSYLWWYKLLMSYHGVNRNFNVTALTRLTPNFPYSVLRDVLKDILTVRRIIELKNKPLTPQEIYEYFIVHNLVPVDDKEWSSYEKWYKSTPIGKRRFKYIRYVEKKNEEAAGAAAKKK